jgi:hypothetical protein
MWLAKLAEQERYLDVIEKKVRLYRDLERERVAKRA